MRPRRIVAVHLPKGGKRRPHLWAAFGGDLRIGTAFVRRCGVICLQMRPPKDADPELRHSMCVSFVSGS